MNHWSGWTDLNLSLCVALQFSFPDMTGMGVQGPWSIKLMVEEEIEEDRDEENAAEEDKLLLYSKLE